MIGFVDASKLFFTRGFEFRGRSSRAEYWWSYLMILLVLTVGALLSSVLGEFALLIVGIFFLFALIPMTALGIRRLHDTNKSAWWLLISIIPFASLLLLVFYCLRGTSGPNKYGEDPYGGIALDVFS